MKRLIVSIIMSLYCILAAAQDPVYVTGVVRDVKNEPVAGAVVMLAGNGSVGTVTDADGRWSLHVPSSVSEPELVVSCLGFKEAKVAVKGRNYVEILLRDDRSLLEESIVVGYGSMKKSDLTGAVSSVSVDEGHASRSVSAHRMLAGRAAGVQVLSNNASPDAGIGIRVRGMGSFSGSSEPLYVVDGVIINGESAAVTTFTVGADTSGSDEAVNGLMGINTQDIERMEILKDASATAIYGSQGANGVVLITTRNAVKDEPVIQASVGIDVSRAYKKIDMLSFSEYLDYADKLHEVGTVPDGTYNTFLRQIYEDPENRSGLKVIPMDWQDYMMRTAVNQRYYFSVSGKPKSMSYRFSFGYSRRQGIVKNTDVDQYTMRLNLFKWITPRVKVGTGTNLSYVSSNLAQGVVTSRIASSASIMRSMLMTRPYMTVYEADDLYEDDAAGPDKWLEDFVNKRGQVRVIPSIYGEYTILPWLKFRSALGGELSVSETTKFKSIRISSTTGNISAIAHSEWMKYNWDNMFLLDKKIGRHSLSGTVGFTMSGSSTAVQTVQGWGADQYKAQEHTINSNPNASFAYMEEGSTLMSVLARIIYSFSDRYVVTATCRADGSSKFKGLNRWCTFPSFAVAWRINQESWFDIPVISMAKLRAGWGLVGNQAIKNYQTMSPYTDFRLGDHSIGGSGYEVGIAPSSLANTKLKWETTEQYNVGLDLGMWKGRLSVNADAYHKITRDLLQQKTIALSSGFSTMYVNQGSVLNQGVELTVEAVPLKTGDLEWTVGGNISFNRNRILEIGEAAESGDVWMAPGVKKNVNFFYGAPMTSDGSNMGALNIFIEGQPMGLFYAFRTDGIIPEGQTGYGFSKNETSGEGHIRYVDVNGNGYIDDHDRTIVGNPNPDFIYGFNTSVTWRNLSLSADFSGVYGNDIYNLNNNTEYRTYQINYNVRRAAVADAWDKGNRDGKFPGLGKMSASDNRYLDTCIEDGSYLRLANVSISYSIPMPEKSFVKSVDIALSASDLFVWTRYSGWDPDVNSFGSGVRRMGIDSNSYPGARTFSIDLKFTL